MSLDEQLKQIKETELALSEETDFFNHNIAWWSSEINRVTEKFQGYEKKHFEGVSEEEIEKLVLSMRYLMNKASLETRTAESIDNKWRKIHLRREILFIQGDFENENARPNRPKYAIPNKQIKIKNKNY